MKKNRIISTIILAIAVIVSISCAHYPKNESLPRYDAAKGYRYPSPEETGSRDHLFVALAFSGGGTRAAAFSYGVLKELYLTPLPGNTARTMLEEVDVISSVSGGSFTAAYYGLFKERVFEDFESRFLYRDIQGELGRLLFSPENWIKLSSPYFNRVDMAAEHYNKTLFDKQTFQHLENQGCRPYIAINATNMTTGAQFTFTQNQFDLIGSDLSRFPVARAVAASSAFPFLLSPVSLVNHPDPAGYELPIDIKNGLKDFGINDRRYFWAKNRAEYQINKSEHPYLHLMDGGLSDNLGIRYILDQYSRASGYIFQRKSKIRKLVIILVNAKTEKSQNLDRSETSPRIGDVAHKTATVSMDNYSFETVQVAQDQLKASITARKNIDACQELIDTHCNNGYEIPPMGHSFDVYFIDINFLKVKDPLLRKRLLSLPTSFSLKRDEVNDLIETGMKLLRESQKFKELLKDLMAR